MLPAFLRNLSHSRVVNRLEVTCWYYRRRFPWLGDRGAACTVKVDPGFGSRAVELEVGSLEDIYQALNMFREANAWNPLDPGFTPATILDLGANCGFSSLYWRTRYPAAQLHGVEMNAANIARCRKLFADNGLAATFHQVAVGDRDGHLTFRAHSSHTRHRLDQLIGDDRSDYADDSAVEVPARTLATLLNDLGLPRLDLLKVDIEGAEQFLLESVANWAPRVRLMLLEVHHNIDPAWARKQLTDAGLVVDVGDSLNRTEWVCKNPALA